MGIEPIIRSKDFIKSGFHRGHLAPVANHTNSHFDMCETFCMSHVCPQIPSMNRAIWLKPEKEARGYTQSFPYVHVITVPLYLPYTDTDVNKYVKYRVIGENEVAVLTHFFKILFLESYDGTILEKGFIIPNEKIAASSDLSNFIVDIDKIKRVAGLVFKQ